MISAAISLATMFAPKLIGLIAGPKAADIAATVVNTAQAITGTTTPEAAKVALQENPEMAVEFERVANELEATIFKERGETMRAAINADKDNPHTTRPKIALGAFRLVSFVTIVVVSMWAVAVWNADAAMVKIIVEGWPWLVAIIAPFVGWLNSYFGILRKEQADKLSASTGQAPLSGIASVVSGFFKK